MICLVFLRLSCLVTIGSIEYQMYSIARQQQSSKQFAGYYHRPVRRIQVEVVPLQQSP